MRNQLEKSRLCPANRRQTVAKETHKLMGFLLLSGSVGSSFKELNSLKFAEFKVVAYVFTWYLKCFQKSRADIDEKLNTYCSKGLFYRV